MSLRKHIHRHATNAYMKIKRLRKSRSNINILVTTLAIVMIWRGAWGIMDIYLFPHQPFLSYLFSLLLGVFLLFVDDEDLGELESN